MLIFNIILLSKRSREMQKLILSRPAFAPQSSRKEPLMRYTHFSHLAKIIALLLSAACFPLPVEGQDLRVLGVVVDGENRPVQGASLTLMKQNFTLRADLEGEFNLTAPSATSLRPEARISTRMEALIDGHHFLVNRVRDQFLGIRLLDLKGTSLAWLPGSAPQFASDRIDLAALAAGSSGNGLHWITIQTRSSFITVPFIKSNGVASLGSKIRHQEAGPLAKMSSGAFDTLRVSKKGYKDKKLIVDREFCDFGKIPLDPDTLPQGVFPYESIADIFVDREDFSVGLGSEVKFSDKYPGGYLLFRFNVDKQLPEKFEAKLTLYAFMAKPIRYSFPYELLKTEASWEEGFGHWYWYNGMKHNNYDKAYTLYPDFIPPEVTENPDFSVKGLRYSNASEVLGSLVSVGKDSLTIDYRGITGSYPLYQNCEKIEIDVTKAVQPGEFTLVLKSLDPAPLTSVHIYTKDHVSDWTVPELTITAKKAGAAP
jgi:hypothetical protein